ncbi:hypothetical protein DFH11DRAFT_1818283 [Phellopilus nigrolimitatus]|nr:hypothetical protein DFH11DRAFT_1818283 [Phellopilus nigrolimitatus]
MFFVHFVRHRPKGLVTGTGTGTGGLKRKNMDEDLEAEEIRQLEERMKMFDKQHPTGTGMGKRDDDIKISMHNNSSSSIRRIRRPTNLAWRSPSTSHSLGPPQSGPIASCRVARLASCRPPPPRDRDRDVHMRDTEPPPPLHWQQQLHQQQQGQEARTLALYTDAGALRCRRGSTFQAEQHADACRPCHPWGRMEGTASSSARRPARTRARRPARPISYASSTHGYPSHGSYTTHTHAQAPQQTRIDPDALPPPIEADKLMRVLFGEYYSHAASILDLTGKNMIYFVFSDLRTVGADDVPVLAQCFGGAFAVYSTKEFPGLKASTELTKHLSRWAELEFLFRASGDPQVTRHTHSDPDPSYPDPQVKYLRVRGSCTGPGMSFENLIPVQTGPGLPTDRPVLCPIQACAEKQAVIWEGLAMSFAARWYKTVTARGHAIKWPQRYRIVGEATRSIMTTTKIRTTLVLARMQVDETQQERRAASELADKSWKQKQRRDATSL